MLVSKIIQVVIQASRQTHLGSISVLYDEVYTIQIERES